MAKPPQPHAWHCPACGDALECGMRAGADTCWCADLPPVAPDPGLADGECLCERCLRERIAAETG